MIMGDIWFWIGVPGCCGGFCKSGSQREKRKSDAEE
jgi:hypothetical protein